MCGDAQAWLIYTATQLVSKPVKAVVLSPRMHLRCQLTRHTVSRASEPQTDVVEMWLLLTTIPGTPCGLCKLLLAYDRRN